MNKLPITPTEIEAWQADIHKPIANGHGNFMLKPALASKGTT